MSRSVRQRLLLLLGWRCQETGVPLRRGGSAVAPLQCLLQPDEAVAGGGLHDRLEGGAGEHDALRLPQHPFLLLDAGHGAETHVLQQRGQRGEELLHLPRNLRHGDLLEGLPQVLVPADLVQHLRGQHLGTEGRQHIFHLGVGETLVARGGTPEPTHSLPNVLVVVHPAGRARVEVREQLLDVVVLPVQKLVDHIIADVWVRLLSLQSAARLLPAENLHRRALDVPDGVDPPHGVLSLEWIHGGTATGEGLDRRTDPCRLTRA